MASNKYTRISSITVDKCRCVRWLKRGASSQESGEFVLQVACMQFINIIVHSVEDVDYRVHLQHEFTLLGLDSYLDVCLYLCMSV